MKKFLKVYVEITNACNFNCIFCAKSKREIRTMSLDEIKHVLKEVKNVTDLITLHIKGEPLLHPNLKEILEECNALNLKVNITTNGSMLLNNIEALKCDSLRQLNISLHSINKIEGINIDNKKYLSDIFKSVKILNEYNPKLYISYRLWNLKNISENEENYEILLSLEKEYSIKDLKEIAKANEYVTLKENIFLNQDTEFKWPNINDEFISDKGRCLGLIKQIGILSDGRVVPCCLDQDGEITLGNIFNQSINEIIDSSLAKEISTGFLENKVIHELCQKCTYRLNFNK